jgi:hypothetical protein
MLIQLQMAAATAKVRDRVRHPKDFTASWTTSGTPRRNEVITKKHEVISHGNAVGDICVLTVKQRRMISLPNASPLSFNNIHIDIQNDFHMVMSDDLVLDRSIFSTDHLRSSIFEKPSPPPPSRAGLGAMARHGVSSLLLQTSSIVKHSQHCLCRNYLP